MTAPEQGTAIELAHAAVMPAPMGGALPTGLEWQALERMATMLADSSLIPYKLKGKPGDVAVILLAAREYGIPPLMALSKLPVVNGTPAPMGELMVALVLRAGHRIGAKFYNPDGTVYGGGPITPQHYGEATYRRAGWDADESLRFTIAEALAAGLIERLDQHGKPVARDDKNRPQPWELYTPNMARWRAVANACRIAFADVLLGLSYLPEELGAIVDAEGAPIEGTVEGPRGAPPAGTVEQRTAQESADRLASEPYPDHVLDAVRGKATELGYIDAPVTYAGERMTLAEALDRHVADRAHVDTVDAVLVEEPPADGEDAQRTHVEEQEAPVEEPSAPQEAEQPVPDPTPTPAGETPQEAAYDVAREALASRDADLIRSLYRSAGSDLRILDVLPVVDDADLATLKAPADLDNLALGSLLIEAGKYVAAHNMAVRDPEPMGPAPAAEGDDPWATDTSVPYPI